MTNSLPNAGVVNSSGCRGFCKDFGFAISHDSSAHKSSMAVSSFRSLKEMLSGSMCIRRRASSSKMAGHCETAACEIIEYLRMRSLSDGNNTVLG